MHNIFKGVILFAMIPTGKRSNSLDNFVVKKLLEFWYQAWAVHGADSLYHIEGMDMEYGGSRVSVACYTT